MIAYKNKLFNGFSLYHFTKITIIFIEPKLCFYYIIYIFMHDFLRKYLIACNAFLVLIMTCNLDLTTLISLPIGVLCILPACVSAPSNSIKGLFNWREQFTSFSRFYSNDLPCFDSLEGELD